MDTAAAATALAASDFHSGATPIWCPGCGDYGVLSSLEHALAAHGRPPHEVVLVSGIGCSSRLPAYTTCYGFHGVHGRALPFAAGAKMARPDLEVIAVGGDGDGYSIGGNHFVHACRRNLDMLYLVMDNRVYGMTKGQPSPTTEPDWDSDIAPGGLGLRPLEPLAVAIAAGATFIAGGFSGRPHELAELIVEGIRWPGFAFIEVLSPCIAFRSEHFGWKERVRPALRTMPLQILSGATTPRESMPEAIQILMLAAPNTHFVILAQAILFRGAGLDVVWPQLAALLGIGTVLFSLSLWRFRRFLK